MIRKAVIVMVLLAFLAPTIQATDDNDEVTVFMECGLLASNGDIFTGTGKLVIEEDEVTFKCTGTQPAPYPDNELRFTGSDYPIFLPSGEILTIPIWEEVIKPDGQVVLKGEIDIEEDNESDEDEEEDDDEDE